MSLFTVIDREFSSVERVTEDLGDASTFVVDKLTRFRGGGPYEIQRNGEIVLSLRWEFVDDESGRVVCTEGPPTETDAGPVTQPPSDDWFLAAILAEKIRLPHSTAEALMVAASCATRAAQYVDLHDSVNAPVVLKRVFQGAACLFLVAQRIREESL